MFNPYESNPYEEKQEFGNGVNKIRVDYKRNRGNGKRGGTSTVNAGGAIIIIIFVVLCLTIFGLLSFITSYADKRLADRNLVSVQEFYSADTKAEQKLAEIYNLVYEEYMTQLYIGYSESLTASLVESSIGDKIDGIVSINETDNEENINIVFNTKVGENQQVLYSEIVLYHDNDSGILSYKILKWNVILTQDFSDYDEESLDVWQGE